MKSLPYILFAFLCLPFVPSCIEEDLDPCPPEEGGIEVRLGVEKFRTRPPYAPSDLEEDFGGRIRSLDYLLYAEGRLIEQGRVDDLSNVAGGTCLFRHDPLPFGNYRLAFVANAAPQSMAGTTLAPELYCFVFRKDPDGDDFFRADFPFEVTCPYRNEYETVLRRVHGVTRFRFEKIPSEITSIEVGLDNVAERMPVSGEPDIACEVVKRFAVDDPSRRAEGSFLVGTFSTLTGKRTSWRLKLFTADSSIPILDRLVTDTLRIESNQLLELKARFEGSDFQNGIEFSVDVDTTWDGSNEGGGGATVS